ncbi:MAG TPA: 7TM-DISM domain-containing protein, partial [Cytophagaceae bacterium]
MEIKKSLLIILIFFGTLENLAIANHFQNVKILKEENRSYSIEELLAKEDLPFQKYDHLPYNGERQQKTYWLKFDYKKDEVENTYFLVLPYILFKRMDIYYKINDSLYHYRTGKSSTSSDQTLFLPSLTLKLPTSQAPVLCYLHVESYFSYFFFFGEEDFRSVIKNTTEQAMHEFFFIGLSFLAGIFSLIFFLFLKDKMYLYYTLFCF